MGISPECDICLSARRDTSRYAAQDVYRWPDNARVFVMTSQIKYLFYTDFSKAKQMTSSYLNDKLKSVFFEQNYRMISGKGASVLFQL